MANVVGRCSLSLLARRLAVPRHDLAARRGARRWRSRSSSSSGRCSSGLRRPQARRAGGSRGRARRSRQLSARGLSIGFAGLSTYPDHLSTRRGSRTATRSSAWRSALGFGPGRRARPHARSSAGAPRAPCRALGRDGRRRARVHVRDRRRARAEPGRLAPLPRPARGAARHPRPRFSALWLLPIVLWVCPRDGQRRRSGAVLPGARRGRASSSSACGSTARDGRSRRRPA